MRTAIVVLSVLGLCLGAPVEPDMGRDNEPVIDEGQFAGSPLDQTDPTTRTVFYPVPKADGLLANPFMNPYGYYPSYPYYPQYASYQGFPGYSGYSGYQGYPGYPSYYPSFSLPPVIISLPQRNP